MAFSFGVMFVVRREQADILTGVAVEQMEDNIAEHLVTCWPDETRGMTDDDLLRWVRYGVERGRPYDIVTEYDVARYLDLMFFLQADFEDNTYFPWAREILEDPTLSGRVKVDRLMEHTTQMTRDLVAVAEAER